MSLVLLLSCPLPTVFSPFGVPCHFLLLTRPDVLHERNISVVVTSIGQGLVFTALQLGLLLNLCSGLWTFMDVSWSPFPLEVGQEGQSWLSRVSQALMKPQQVRPAQHSALVCFKRFLFPSPCEKYKQSFLHYLPYKPYK